MTKGDWQYLAVGVVTIPAIGWAGGDQGMHLRYGAEGIADSAFLKALDEAARKAHAPIIKALA
jgi:hypothetical protein